jgi:hypothetical protein
MVATQVLGCTSSIPILADINHKTTYWLVVSTPLKNISQWEGLSHILWKNKTCSKPPIRYKTEYAIFELS